jgi:hypothetical protein
MIKIKSLHFFWVASKYYKYLTIRLNQDPIFYASQVDLGSNFKKISSLKKVKVPNNVGWFLLFHENFWFLLLVLSLFFNYEIGFLTNKIKA